MKIVTQAQMSRIEQLSEKEGVSTDTLMENAGLAVARCARKHIGRIIGVPVVVLVGPGNNGGDGLVAARHLHAWGARVTVYICVDRKTDHPKLNLLLKAGVPVTKASDDTGLAELRAILVDASMVIDAILGTGKPKPIDGLLKDVMMEVSDARRERQDFKVLALDLPSGLNADTGEVDPATIPADITVTLGMPKVGLYMFPGAGKLGYMEIADIGLPAGLDDDIPLTLMTRDWAKAALPSRPLSAHKGTFGSTLIIAGSRNYIGAAALSASAACRVGSGLVTLAIPASLQSAVAASVLEPTYTRLVESSPGTVHPEAADSVLEKVGDYNALLVGCGLGAAPETYQFLERVLFSGVALPPLVLDADGLNFLSTQRNPPWWTRIKGPAVLTPHPGEMGRLTESLVKEVQGDRLRYTREMSKKWGKVVVLKSAFTIVASPEGQAMLSPFANPGLASAGTGDVLAGTIAGFLSQGVSPEKAAALGVYIHGAAGEIVRDRIGDTGMVASDLLCVLPWIIKDLKAGI